MRRRNEDCRRGNKGFRCGQGLLSFFPRESRGFIVSDMAEGLDVLKSLPDLRRENTWLHEMD